MSDFDSDPVQSEQESSPEADTGMSKEARQWAMILHFSLLAGFVIPFAGLLAPILIWQLKKEDLPEIVPHAHVVLNWIITGLVYWVICFILFFVLIGIPLMIVLALATVAFSIIGGIKANDGELWEYPMTMIKVFK
jgi:uncharacterized Tic20 family protein